MARFYSDERKADSDKLSRDNEGKADPKADGGSAAASSGGGGGDDGVEDLDALLRQEL